MNQIEKALNQSLIKSNIETYIYMYINLIST